MEGDAQTRKVVILQPPENVLVIPDLCYVVDARRCLEGIVVIRRYKR